MPLNRNDTTVEVEERAVRLLDAEGNVLIEFTGHQIDDARRRGDYCPDDPHGSLFEHVRMLADIAGVEPIGEPAPEKPTGDFDADFLDGIGIRWD
jgi:hypothetical protein